MSNIVKVDKPLFCSPFIAIEALEYLISGVGLIGNGIGWNALL